MTAYNFEGFRPSLPLRITVDAFGIATKERPRLFVLAAGVDKYAMKDLELKYAVKDAKAFVEAMRVVGANLFADIKTTPLYDQQVTKANLEREIGLFSAEVRAEDVFVLFISGHGKSIGGRYFYLQQDLDFSKGQIVERDALGHKWWENWLAKISAHKVLLIYDTCESAAASGLVRGKDLERITAMDQLQRASGRNMIAAARQAAFEGYQGHGVLTFALLQVFQKPIADPSGVAQVDVVGLAKEVGQQVPNITQALYGIRQEPIHQLGGSNFPIGLRILPPRATQECPEAETFIVIESTALRDAPGSPDRPDGRLVPAIALGPRSMAIGLSFAAMAASSAGHQREPCSRFSKAANQAASSPSKIQSACSCSIEMGFRGCVACSRAKLRAWVAGSVQYRGRCLRASKQGKARGSPTPPQ